MRWCFFFLEKIYLRRNYSDANLEPLLSGSKLADFSFYTTCFSPFLYAGCTTTTAFLQHSRIHTQML
jgi:hypothetical protein